MGSGLQQNKSKGTAGLRFNKVSPGAGTAHDTVPLTPHSAPTQHGAAQSETAAAEDEEAPKDEGELRAGQGTAAGALSEGISLRQQNTSQRLGFLSSAEHGREDSSASFAMEGSVSGKMAKGSVKIAPVSSGKAFAWSGRTLTTRQSQVFFQLLHSADILESPGEVAPAADSESGLTAETGVVVAAPGDTVQNKEEDDVLTPRLVEKVVQALPEEFQIVDPAELGDEHVA